MKKCPFDKQPCIKEECMAWSGKQDLKEIEKNHKENFDALIEQISVQEHVSLENARKIIEIRNNDERCKLITPESVI